jgi:mono/diheme cytochrome c family protein
MSSHKKQYSQLSLRAKTFIFLGSRKTVYRYLSLVLAVPLLCVIAASLQLEPPNPVYAASHKDQEMGAVLFHKTGCERCHGVDGVGTEKAPSLRNIGTIWKKSQIKRQILNGGHEMPPFRDALRTDEVNALVGYLSAKREARTNPR